MYEGPYKIIRKIRKNVYLIGNEDNEPIGVYNSRQLRPHKEARLKPEIRMAMIRIAEKSFDEIKIGSYKSFCSGRKEETQ